MKGWLRKRWWVLVLAVACGIFLSESQASTTVKLVVVAVLAVALIVWNIVHNLRIHMSINRHAALGEPEAMLTLIEPALAGAISLNERIPFTIYKANALAMQGEFETALELLESVELKNSSGDTQRTWRLLHSVQRMHCLCFVGRLDEAELALKEQIEPFAMVVRSPATGVIVDEARAKLAFFQGRHEDCRALLKALLDDQRIMPASVGLYHYLLGRIAEAAGDDPSEHFTQARELAPKTFVGAAASTAGSVPSQAPQEARRNS